MLSLNNPKQTVWFVIPAYEEAEVISVTVREVLALCPNVVVVVDGAQDDTAELARLAGARTIEHPINLGQGAALQTGIDFVLEQKASFIFTFDADGQHVAEDTVNMLDRMQSSGCDVVLGSRFRGHAVGIPRLRRLFLRGATLYLRLSTGLKLTDAHNGLRLFRASAARQLNIQHNGMAHASEILNTIGRLRLTYQEAPVTVRYTEYSLRKGQRLSNSLQILSELFLKRFSK